MNKKELVGALASKCDMTQAAATETLNAFCDIVVSELKDGNGVAIPGFGQFIAKHRPSREMRNPATGKMMMSKAKTSAQFKPSIGLKDL
ncbi:HU family DNA-binding protein [Robiginitomaculum antarcticum]|uniref:HU family DNA-binding protein n=1 Tax=Robiginitomaculum antarcticum TaxID=437507 RepID=UPI0003697A9D|nr:HU family DNA-binding protein [Robiginitomaculum antarcticum]